MYTPTFNTKCMEKFAISESRHYDILYAVRQHLEIRDGEIFDGLDLITWLESDTDVCISFTLAELLSWQPTPREAKLYAETHLVWGQLTEGLKKADDEKRLKGFASTEISILNRTLSREVRILLSRVDY